MGTSNRIENADEHHMSDLKKKFEEHIKGAEREATEAKERAKEKADMADRAKDAEDQARIAWRQAQDKLDKTQKGMREADANLDQLTKKLEQTSRVKENLEKSQRTVKEELGKIPDDGRLKTKIDDLKKELTQATEEFDQTEKKRIAAEQEVKTQPLCTKVHRLPPGLKVLNHSRIMFPVSILDG